jgi:hypothetical protein
MAGAAAVVAAAAAAMPINHHIVEQYRHGVASAHPHMAH